MMRGNVEKPMSCKLERVILIGPFFLYSFFPLFMGLQFVIETERRINTTTCKLITTLYSCMTIINTATLRLIKLIKYKFR